MPMVTRGRRQAKSKGKMAKKNLGKLRGKLTKAQLDKKRKGWRK